MSSLLVVVGVNGRQGTAVALTFLKLPGWRVRGLTSSPLCPASEKWRALGVEIFEVDLNNESSVRAAVRDATAIFMVTDFYAQLADHSVKTFASLTSKPAEGIACQRDYQAGKTLLFAAADVPGLQRVVLSTIRTKPISMRGREQVKAKVQLVHWLKGTFPELWQKTSYIQPCLRMEDLVSLLKRNQAGSLQLEGTAPWHAGYPWVSMTKDFGKISRALFLNAPTRSNVAAISGYMSGHEICKLIEQISGLPCTYKQLTAAEVSNVNGNIMVDLVSNQKPWNFYTAGTLTPQQLAGHNHFDLPLTEFKDILAEMLPRRLEQLLNQPESLKAFVFATDYKPSDQEARALSEEVARVGYNPPHPINHNGHDRAEFIGNHPMIQQPVSRRKKSKSKIKSTPTTNNKDIDGEAVGSGEEVDV